jgi:hypothetical protein
MEYVPLLGGIERNASGVIVSAKSLLTIWVVQVNISDIDYAKSGNLAGTGDLVNMPSNGFSVNFTNWNCVSG